MMNKGARIRAMREQRGWSQDELAKRAGITQGAVGHIELERRPITAAMERVLSVAFEIPFAEFHQYLMMGNQEVSNA